MEKPPSEMDFVKFEVLEEPWNDYRLEDGSTLRVKVVLKNVIKETETSFFFQVANVLAVVPNPDYIGLPSPQLKEGENIRSFVEAEDLKILSNTDLWNEYKLPSENITLKIKGVVVEVSRTKRHDRKGLPIYLGNVQVLSKPKKHILTKKSK